MSMPKSYEQSLRETALEYGDTPEEKAFALNLVEAVISNEMTDKEIIDAVMNDTLPREYWVRERKGE